MTARRNQLQYLVAVAEDGQITSAARRLNLAQPALSQAIAQLEAEIGVELLERRPRGVRLTPAGEIFLDKARTALSAEREAERTVSSLARAARGVLSIGFIGPPPDITMSDLFGGFARRREGVRLSFRDLPFPSGETSSWLDGVDVAVAQRPQIEDGLSAVRLRTERRAVVTHGDHPLARKQSACVADVVDETFVSFDECVQPAWAGFHSLDDHRGGPPARLTEDRAVTAPQMLGIMANASAVTIVPETDARLAALLVPGLAVVPIVDADPAEIMLVCRSAPHNPIVEALLAAAAEAGADEL